MNSLKVCYGASRYKSHLRTAQIYCELLKGRFELTASVSEAQILILHKEPIDFSRIYEEHPELSRKYVIAYSVWEASDLPEVYIDSIGHVQEVWSCSRYSCDAFRKHHPAVVEIPHVIERDTYCSDVDRLQLRQAIAYDSECIYYLAVTRVRDKRKNVETLIKAFRKACERMPRARLIIKGTLGDPLHIANDPQIVYLPLNFTRSQLNGLYELSSVYVSAHHSEGWGLTLSDAMIFGKPVIATGYSGNLEFMNPSNSFLVKCKEEYIRSEDCSGLYNSKMKWAYPDEISLTEMMTVVYENLDKPLVLERTAKASRDITVFDRGTVKEILFRRLESVVSRLGPTMEIPRIDQATSSQFP
jgi:glycosyltransferase involved in cell wall biosynthesis